VHGRFGARIFAIDEQLEAVLVHFKIVYTGIELHNPKDNQ